MTFLARVDWRRSRRLLAMTALCAGGCRWGYSEILEPGPLVELGTGGSGGAISSAGGSASSGGAVTGGTAGAGGSLGLGGVAGAGGGAAGAPSMPQPVVVLTGNTLTAQHGGTNTNYVDACPDNQVLVGFQGTTKDVGTVLVGGIQALCGVLEVDGSGSTAIHSASGATLPWHGSTDVTPWSQMCPADQVVVSFDGRSGSSLDQVIIGCAPLTVSGSSVMVGSVTFLTPAGGSGGSAYSDGCPAGQVARGTNLNVNNTSWVDAFGLMCGVPTIEMVSTP